MVIMARCPGCGGRLNTDGGCFYCNKSTEPITQEAIDKLNSIPSAPPITPCPFCGKMQWFWDSSTTAGGWICRSMECSIDSVDVDQTSTIEQPKSCGCYGSYRCKKHRTKWWD